MEENNDPEKVEEVMLPGFRFHPTDEELVGFYLKRKIQQKPLSIELIKQLDIYKFDPWDLPKMATTGEKEWYFYCPRDRKYRNSARPNRVTGAGFWKATGTDRPIYASEGTKCIGLKKSLVFYKGRAAKGIKTDWMMHEFRLPSVSDPSHHHPKRPIMDKSLPANDSWAICRIFKKSNSMAQRALSHSWVTPLPQSTDGSEMFSHVTTHYPILSTENASAIHLTSSCDDHLQQSFATSFPPLDLVHLPCYKPAHQAVSKPPPHPLSSTTELLGPLFPPLDMSLPNYPKSSVDVSSMLLNLSPSLFGELGRSSGSIDFTSQQQSSSSSSFGVPQAHVNGNMGNGDHEEVAAACSLSKNSEMPHNQWGSMRTVSSFPFSLTPNLSETWKPSLAWDSPPRPTEMSTSYSTNKCTL